MINRRRRCTREQQRNVKNYITHQRPGPLTVGRSKLCGSGGIIRGTKIIILCFFYFFISFIYLIKLFFFFCAIRQNPTLLRRIIVVYYIVRSRYLLNELKNVHFFFILLYCINITNVLKTDRIVVIVDFIGPEYNVSMIHYNDTNDEDVRN